MIANASDNCLNADLGIFAQGNQFAPVVTNTPIPHGISLPNPKRYDPDIAGKIRERDWKLDLLAPAFGLPKRSKARGEILRSLADQTHRDINGQPVQLSERTLRRWLDDVDSDDLSALARKPRNDRKKRRCLISRAWDACCPLSDTVKAQLAGELDTYVRSLWASGAPGASQIEAFASSKLAELCRAAGWHEAAMQNCRTGRTFIERHREVEIVAIKERDAKRFFDHYTPRIKRNRNEIKPMDVVIGDVHPLDVIKDHNGREVHARLIAWLDLATYDIHITPVILDKGRGIRQEDIARSFVAMVKDWGLPRSLYLDNGSEYKWEEMMDGFRALTGLVDSFEAFVRSTQDIGELIDTDEAAPLPETRAIIRARPYNAPAKQIEAVFGNLERNFFSMMPGWIGGDRMKKRTHKVGAAPRAYQGDTAEFERDLNTCLELYRNKPQADGSSPYDKRRAFYAQGWQPIRAAREVFLFAFSEVQRIKVHAGGINVAGTWGHADVLIPLVGKTIDVRVAKWDRDQTLYLDADEKLHCIPMGQTFKHGDIEGAKEQARRAGVLSDHIKALKAGTVRKDLLEESARHVAALPPPPELPAGITIKTAESKAIEQALNNVSAPPALKLSPGQHRHPNTGQIYGLPPPKEKGPNAAPTSFDPMKALLSAPRKKEKPNAETPTFDPIKNLSVTHRKEMP